MSNSNQSATTSSLATLLRPLIRLLIKQGFSYASFAEVTRRLFVDVAAEDFTIPGKKQSLSRISVLTGINRKDVAKIQDRSRTEKTDTQNNNRPSRIIQGWLRDEDFINASGSPKPLHFEGAEHSFSELVRRYGGDVTPRAVLDELLRVNVVDLNPQQRIVLCASAYIPQTDLEEKFRIMGRATHDLFTTLDHNLDTDRDNPHHTTRLQRSVAYSNIPVKALSQIRLRSKEEGEQFLLQINQWLSQQDTDINPDAQGSGKARAGIGIYYFEDVLEQEADT